MKPVIKSALFHGVLQICDIITTLIAVVLLGMTELNPLAKYYLNNNILMFVSIKLLLSILIILMAIEGNAQLTVLKIINVIYSLVVISNIGHLLYVFIC